MSRSRIGVIAVVLVLGAVVLPIGLPGGIAAAVSPSIETACTGSLSGSTFTLTSDCDTTVQLTVPDGVTVDGGGHIITAHDPLSGNFGGAVLTNDPTGHSMSVQNLTIEGTGFAVACLGQQLIGLFFNDASGSVTGVHVEGITQHSGCPLGQGIRANAVAGTARTVTITNTVVSDYQKGALVASGMMTMNVSSSTLGPPDRTMPVLLPSQNGVQYGGVGVNAGAGGTLTNSVIYGSGFGKPVDAGLAVMLYGATGVTLSGDTITGDGTDVGVSVSNASTGVAIDRNQIGRTAPDDPDNLGFGVEVDTGSTASLSCNTFSGWNEDIVGLPPQPPCPATPGAGYWMTAADGGVFNFGAAAFLGSQSNTPLAAPVVRMAASAGGGYWLVSSDGAVFPHGAGSYGSLSGQHLNAPITGVAPTPDGFGYYLVGADGGVFTFGDAHFQGSMAGELLNKPVVGIAVTPDNEGYYLVASDGGVFTFGDAHFQGSMGGELLNKPVVGMAVDTATSGYWLTSADGGVFAFDSPFFGSAGNLALNADVVSIAATDGGQGYRIVGADGGVFCFGAAQFLGSMAGTPLNKPVVGMASTEQSNLSGPPVAAGTPIPS
jgi:hypothetical protein